MTIYYLYMRKPRTQWIRQGTAATPERRDFLLNRWAAVHASAGQTREWGWLSGSFDGSEPAERLPVSEVIPVVIRSEG